LGAGCGLVGLCLAMDKPKQVSGQLLWTFLFFLSFYFFDSLFF
jgi:hypothetical protein